MPRRKSEQPYRAKADLSVLFGDETAPTSAQTVPLDSISLPDRQPRRYFDPEKMEQLVHSVKAHGILENLLVRPLKDQDNQYELIAGERRYRAAQAAGLEEVPVTIREVTGEQALQMSLVENLLREDLNPVEETEGILQFLAIRLDVPTEEIPALLYRMQHEAKGQVAQNVLGSEQGQAVQAVFEQLGKLNWESFVTSRLPLLNLPTELLEALRSGQIAYTKAQAIARVKETSERQALLSQALAENLSLGQIRERIQALQCPTEPASPTATRQAKASIQAVTRRLTSYKVWENPKKWEKVQALLQQLEALIEAD